MNSLCNNLQLPQSTDKMFAMGDKRNMTGKPDSLFSMALYDSDLMNQAHLSLDALPPQAPAPGFHPVDEYKDLSLKELLELSDEYMFREDDEKNLNAALNPIPLNVPFGQSVGSMAGTPAPRGFADPSFGLLQPQMLMAPQMPPSSVVSMMPVNNKKRQREVSDDEGDDELNNDGRFRPYQAGQWAERFNDLCTYREEKGNCLVPHTYKKNLALARWVKRQRYQYKLMMQGKSSTMTEERVKALEEIGFVWDSQGAAWGERLDELRDFRTIYMHCNVPSNYSENPQLATWVKCQRRQYKLHMEGKPSNMTAQRIRDLESVGFEWLLRSYKKAKIGV